MEKRLSTLAWNRLIVVALLFVSALVAFACGGDEGGGAAEAEAFTHGVASGDVGTDSAVLWTRTDREAEVTVDVATDESFSAVVATATARALPEDDFTVQVLVAGLEAGGQYYYRFRSGELRSETGAFRTAPTPDEPASFRFVLSGDSDGRREDGVPAFNSFEVLDLALAEEPHFFLYFGDTIYGDEGTPARTLDDYRAKYKVNREYATLRRILAGTSIYTIWDDHEVENDFDGQTVDPELMAAGREAFQEYLPMGPFEDPAVMYRTFRWGSAAEFIILDQRSFRSGDVAESCSDAEGDADLLPFLGAPDTPDDAKAVRALVDLPEETSAACLQALRDPARTMLGDAQKEFLKDALGHSDATWKFIVNEVPITELMAIPYDRWEGYRAERDELLAYIRDNDIRNVVFLTTDLHGNIIADVRIDVFAETDPVAKEIIAGPIATNPIKRELDDMFGAGTTDQFVFLLGGIAKPDCIEPDSYSYALVEVDAGAGTVSVSIKDDTGRLLCETTLTAR